MHIPELRPILECGKLRTVGRPSKLDDLVSRRILDAIEAGVSHAGAAKAARIAESTLQDWLARGRDGEPGYAEFAVRLREAEGKAERTIVDKLFEAAKKGNVGAMCFWLERRRHRDWGKRDVANDDARDVATTTSNESDLEVARSVVAALESRRSA